MITIVRVNDSSHYRIRCDGCGRSVDSPAVDTLREAYQRFCRVGWDVAPPFPCERRSDLKAIAALCPACCHLKKKDVVARKKVRRD